MATATILPDQNTIVAEIFIAAPPARVFQAITDPAQISQWWGQKDMYRVTAATADLRPGGKWSSVGIGKDGMPFRVDGEYVEIDPPRLLVYTWRHPNTPLTVVRWELEPTDVHGLHASGPRKAGTGTLLKIRHEGFAGDIPAIQSHGEGWKRVLGWLWAFAEKNETIDSRE